MIRLDDITFRHADAAEPTLRSVCLSIGEGELCVVAGPTGAGKSTLLGTINGLVPHATGGTMEGSVTVAGHDTSAVRPRDLAEVVGHVGQDPAMGFVTASVEDELAYSLEQLGVAPGVMRARVEETFDLMGLAPLRRAPMSELSGGQQQRVAIGSVLVCGPRVLVLDEPTSALDPGAAEDVLAALTRLVHDLGLTVVLAEHRLERVVAYADRLVIVRPDGTVTDGSPSDMLATSAIAPPLVDLGRALGWDPLPLSVRDARRNVGDLVARLGTPPSSVPSTGPVAVRCRRLTVDYGPVRAVDTVDLDLRSGEVTALMGRNGSGKSSLLWAIQGSGPHTGEVEGAGSTALVPQTPGDLVYLRSVAEECAETDAAAGVTAGTTAALLERILPGVRPATHPADLSEGERLALVLAIQLATGPEVVLLDEPTRGLDYPTKRRLVEVVGELAAGGAAVMIATHDVEFAAAAADRVVVMAEGEIITDGPAAETLTGTPLLHTQVAKVLAPAPWLTVEQVVEAASCD